MIGCLVLLLVAAIEWFVTCALVKLITLCFGWGFSWLFATGIWLVLLLITAWAKK